MSATGPVERSAAVQSLVRNWVARAVSLAAVVAWVAVGVGVTAHIHPLTVASIAAVAVVLAAEATLALIALTETVSAAGLDPAPAPLVAVPITAGVMLVFLGIVLLTELMYGPTGHVPLQLRLARELVPVAGIGTAVADYWAARALARAVAEAGA